jgi:hypothetical protein
MATAIEVVDTAARITAGIGCAALVERSEAG